MVKDKVNKNMTLKQKIKRMAEGWGETLTPAERDKLYRQVRKNRVKGGLISLSVLKEMNKIKRA